MRVTLKTRLSPLAVLKCAGSLLKIKTDTHSVVLLIIIGIQKIHNMITTVKSFWDILCQSFIIKLDMVRNKSNKNIAVCGDARCVSHRIHEWLSKKIIILGNLFIQITGHIIMLRNILIIDFLFLL